jgi:hypothetical protein
MTVARLTVTLVALHLGSFAPAVESASPSGNGADSQSFQTEYVDIDRFLPPELLKPMERDFEDSTLEEFLKTVGEMTGYVVRPDVKTLTDSGVALQDPIIAGRLKGRPLYLALRVALDNVNGVKLAWKLEERVFVVSTDEQLSDQYETMIVDVSDLLQAGYSPRSLVQLLERNVVDYTEWSKSDGQGGSASIFGTSLVVRQIPRINNEIRCLLIALKSDAPKVVLMKNRWDREIEKALERSVSCDFPQATLQQAMEHFSKEVGIPIDLDRQTLTDSGAPPDFEISLTISNEPLKNALRLLLENINGVKLLAIAMDGRLLITTEEAIVDRHFTNVYHLPKLFEQDSASALIKVLQDGTGEEVYWRDRDCEGGLAVLMGSRSLVVEQTLQNLGVVESLLDNLLAVATQHPPAAQRPPESNDTVEVRRRSLPARQAEDLKRVIPKMISPGSWAQLPDGTAAAIDTIDTTKSEVAQIKAVTPNAPTTGLGGALIDLAREIIDSRKADPSQDKVILFIRQTRAVQDEIEAFIEDLETPSWQCQSASGSIGGF